MCTLNEKVDILINFHIGMDFTEFILGSSSIIDTNANVSPHLYQMEK